MTWLLVALAVLALGGVAVVAAGRGAPLVEEYDDRPDVDVPPTGTLRGADLRRVRFPLAVRGYRMAEVDALLDRVATQMEEAERSGDHSGDHSGGDPESRRQSHGEPPGPRRRGGPTTG